MVIKIGSSLLVDESDYSVNHTWMRSFVDDLVFLRKQGINIILVSSGATAFGKIALHLRGKALTLEHQQAVAAVGQVRLMHAFQTLLHAHNVTVAQVLLTLGDSENRRRFLNSRNTLRRLLSMDVLPIINENDTVATREMRYGDNDRLAARVAQMVEADTVVLLSDIEGLYTADPRKTPSATLIPTVRQLTPDILAMGGESGTRHGSGGMITKLAAAQISMQSGCRLLITKGKVQNPLRHFINTNIGTWFLPDINPKNAKKTWLAQHLQPEGAIKIDAGAVRALEAGASLLPIGVLGVMGKFQKGAPVRIIHEAEQQVAIELARGLVNYASHEIQQLIKQPTSQIESILGYAGSDEIVHRDDLVMLS